MLTKDLKNSCMAKVLERRESCQTISDIQDVVVAVPSSIKTCSYLVLSRNLTKILARGLYALSACVVDLECSLSKYSGIVYHPTRRATAENSNIDGGHQSF